MPTTDFSEEGLAAEHARFIERYGFKPNVLTLPADVFRLWPKFHLPVPGVPGCCRTHFDCTVRYSGLTVPTGQGYYSYEPTAREMSSAPNLAQFMASNLGEPYQEGSQGTQGAGPGCSGTPGPQTAYRQSTGYVIMAPNIPEYKGMDHFYAGDNTWVPRLADAVLYTDSADAATVCIASDRNKHPPNCARPVIRTVRAVRQLELLP